MGISGNLKTMDLAELLQWLSQGQKTGTLVIHATAVEKRIYFRDGRIISSSSNDPKEYLGHFLVSHGFIDEATLANAIRMQEEKKMLLGSILVTLGAIDEKNLHRMLRLKAEESIFEIFSWPEGEFRFLDSELPSHEMVPLSLDVTGIVLEGGRRLDETRRVRTYIPSNAAIPVAVGELVNDEEEFPGGQRILDAVDDDRTIEEICMETHASEYQVCRVLYEQIRHKRVKVVKPRKRAAAAAAPAPAPSAADPVVTPDALLAEGMRRLEEKAYEPALRYLRAARSLDPESKKIADSVKRAEELVQGTILARGVSLQSIPVLQLRMDELTKHKFTPQEGFLLSRINGAYDVGSILKISPMPPLDAQLVLVKLLDGGFVKLKNR